MDNQCLVTGSSGLVGANVVKHLNDRGIAPRVLIRKTSNTLGISDLKWEPCYGDLTDPESLSRAVEGCGRVFHSAAYISFWKKRWDEVMRVNIEGTRNLLGASRKAGVKKFVLTSSMAAVGFTDDPRKQVDENSEWNYEPFRLIYHTSKRRSEELVLGASNDSFQTFALNPGIIFGERDVHMTAARYFKHIKRFPVPVASRGGVMVTDADDLAEAHILAAEKGAPGERYIIAGEFMMFKELFGTIAEIVGKKPPRWVLPGWAALAIGRMGSLYEKISGLRPAITYDMAVMGNAFEHASCVKSRTQLGVGFTPARVSMEKSYRWVTEHNLM